MQMCLRVYSLSLWFFKQKLPPSSIATSTTTTSSLSFNLYLCDKLLHAFLLSFSFSFPYFVCRKHPQFRRQNALGLGIWWCERVHTTQYWTRVCKLFVDDAAHYRRHNHITTVRVHIETWDVKVATVAHQLQWHRSHRPRQTIAIDHNDLFAWLGNGLQVVHANSNIHFESVPCDINAAGVFAGSQTIQMDNHIVSNTHPLLEWAAVGIPLSRARFPKNYIRIANVLCSTRFDVCDSRLFAQARW